MAFVPDAPVGRFVPDAPPGPPAPRMGAAAIPTAADEGIQMPAGPSTLVNPQLEEAGARAARMRAAPPTFAQKLTGAVEAGINTATMLVGGALGMPLGAAGTVFGVSGQPNLEKGMEAGAAGVGGALKRMLTGPMDLNAPDAPDSDVGAEYTEKVNAAMGDLQPLIGHAGGVGVDFPNMQTATRAAGDLYRAKGAPAARAAVGPKVMGALETTAPQAVRKLVGVDPELAKVAQIAGSLKYPIDVRPDQVIENAKFSKLAGQAAADVPLANSKRSSNQTAFTRNLIEMLNPEETKADRLSPDTFDTAMRRSGEGIGEITARTPIPEPHLVPQLGKAIDLSKATEDNRRIVTAYIGDIKRAAEEGGGRIDGTRLKEINSEIGKQARSNADSDLGRYLNDLQDVIQDAVERNASPKDIKALKDFRRQYAYGKMVEPLVAKTIDGKISPEGLMARVTATKQGKHFMARSMGGPIGDLAKVGKLIKEPGSSLTTERSLVYGAGLGGGAFIEPHTAAAAYGSALAYNTLGPKVTRALVGKKPAPKAPPGPPPDPTTSPGAGGGGGGGTPPRPGPLGDLTPDWQTTPGAGGGKPRGGEEPGLVPAIDDKPPTTGNRKTPLQIPAVPGRPDLPDTMIGAAPEQVSASERSSDLILNDPATIIARRRAEPKLPAGEVIEGQPEIKPEPTGKIPVGKATEGQPEIDAKAPTKPLKTGEATELPVERIEPESPIEGGEVVDLTPEQDAAWRKEFGLDEREAERAKAVAVALRHDAEAVEKAATQLENQPRAFDREIARITEEGQARANESQQAAAGSEGTPPAGDAAKLDTYPAAPAAGEQPRPDSDAAPDRGGEQAAAGGQAPDGAASAIEVRETARGFEAFRDGKMVGYLHDNLKKGQAEQLGENASVEMVKVHMSERGKREVGPALYKAFHDKHGGRIQPNGKTEPGAWKLWKREYPAKVEEFVQQEAKRIADGADKGLVLGNIKDAEIAQRVNDAAAKIPPKPAAVPLVPKAAPEATIVRTTNDPLNGRVHYVKVPGDDREFAINRGDNNLGSPTWALDIFDHWASGPAQSQNGFVSANLGDNKADALKALPGVVARLDAEPKYKKPAAKPPELMTEAEYGAIQRTKYLQQLDQDLADAKSGKTTVGPFSRYKSKAAAVRELLAEIDKATDAKPESFASDHLAEINKAIAAGKTPSPENIKRYDLEAVHGKRLQPDDLQPAAGEKAAGKTPEPPEEIFSAEKQAPFYSPLNRAVEGLKMERAPAQGWLDAIKGMKGIKPEEIEWSGVREWLGTREGKVTKAELQDYLREGGVKVEEVQKGSGGYEVGELDSLLSKWADEHPDTDAAKAIRQGHPWNSISRIASASGDREVVRMIDARHEGDVKYKSYQLPGGTNYREVLLTLPPKTPEQLRVVPHPDDPKAFAMQRPDGSYVVSGADSITPGAVKQWHSAEFAERYGRDAHDPGRQGTYKSPHWEEPNVLAHIRLNDRVDAEGRKVLFVEEVQSDWAQKGKRVGFVTKEDRAAIAAGKAKYAELKKQYDVLEEQRQAAKDALTVEAKRLLKDTHPGLYQYSDLLSRSDRVELTAKYRKLQETDPEFRRVKADVEEFDTEQRALYKKMIEAERPEGEASNKVPGAPFVGKTDAWTALAIKRIAKMAVDEGYDRVAFINGEQSAARYDLSKAVSEVKYDRGSGELIANDLHGSEVIREHVAATPEALEPYIGKEAAEKLAKKIARADERDVEDRKAWSTELDEDTGRWFLTDSNGEAHYDEGGDLKSFRSQRQAEQAIDQLFAENMNDDMRHPAIRGLDLKVGGEGMKAFYDKIVPNVAKDVVKKLGGDGLTDVSITQGGKIDALAVQTNPHVWQVKNGTTKKWLAADGSWVDDPVTAREFRSEAAARDTANRQLAQGEGSAQTGFDITPQMRENAAGGVPMFKGDEHGGKPLGSPEAAEGVLRAKFGEKLIDGLIEQGLLKFALALDEGQTRDLGRGAVKAMFRQKKDEQPSATLYFDRLTAEQAPAALMHELGEHFGAPRLIGEQRYALVMDELKGLAKTDPEVKAAWDHVEHNYIGEGTPNKVKLGDDTFMREVAAHLVETQPDLPWVRRLINEIRAFFYEHFGTTMGNRVDANLIRGLAAAALRKASTGGLAGQQPAPRQFKPFVPSSRMPTPSQRQ